MTEKGTSWRKRLTVRRAAGLEKKPNGSQEEGISFAGSDSSISLGSVNSLKSKRGLCEVCTGLFNISYPFEGKEPWRTPEYTHHSSMKSLATSAELGCQICLKLRDTLSASQKDMFAKNIESSTISKYFITDERTRAFSGDMYELHLYISPEQNSETTVEFILQPSFGESKPAPTVLLFPDQANGYQSEVNKCISKREIPATIEIGPSMAIANE